MKPPTASKRPFQILTLVVAVFMGCRGVQSAQPPMASTQTPMEPQNAAPTFTRKPQRPSPQRTNTPAAVQVTPGTIQVTYTSGGLKLPGYLCIPRGAGPFPAVVYNHGGLGAKIGGAPRETCEALAQDGYVGFSPIRRPTRALAGHIDDVFAAVDYVMRLDYVVHNRLAIIGFSRGGLLTFMAATRSPDFRAFVLMAPAPGGQNDLQQAISRASKVSAPVLVLVAENDVYQANHVELSYMVRDALESGGKKVKFILYPPFRRDGHLMFSEVGDYWRDIRKFLSEHLAKD